MPHQFNVTYVSEHVIKTGLPRKATAFRFVDMADYPTFTVVNLLTVGKGRKWRTYSYGSPAILA